MSRTREAALHRELSRIHAELANVIDGVFDGGEPEDRPVQVQPRRSRPRALTRPAGEAPSHVAAQAARILKEKGFA